MNRHGPRETRTIERLGQGSQLRVIRGRADNETQVIYIRREGRKP